jgi:hypothetical protein
MVPVVAQSEPPQPIDPGQIPALPDFLEILAGPTGWVMLGVLASMRLARWPWYNNQPSEIKRVLPVVAAAIVAIIARVLVTYVPESFWIAIGPYWLIIAGTIATWVGTQVWYQISVRPRKQEQEEREYKVIE